MKLISLNTWAGKEFDPLMAYVSTSHADFFCFQEIYSTPTLATRVGKCYRANLFEELAKRLPEHTGYFAGVQEDWCDGSIDFEVEVGLAMFVRNGLKINDIGERFIFGSHNSLLGDNTSMPRNLQYISFNMGGQDYTLAHLHGLWNGRGKTDTKERLRQSHIIKEFLDQARGKKILCGDFNLLPETRSLSLIEEDLINLIRAYDITTTRSSLYLKPLKFADYTFVSPDVLVEHFVVPQIDVSDHLPMELTFS
ncbi:MAG: hypothetical protein Q8R18_00310 [bacterium]|nr:hypothetical protein [bacterium]